LFSRCLQQGLCVPYDGCCCRSLCHLPPLTAGICWVRSGVTFTGICRIIIVSCSYNTHNLWGKFPLSPTPTPPPPHLPTYPHRYPGLFSCGLVSHEPPEGPSQAQMEAATTTFCKHKYIRCALSTASFASRIKLASSHNTPPHPPTHTHCAPLPPLGTLACFPVAWSLTRAPARLRCRQQPPSSHCMRVATAAHQQQEQQLASLTSRLGGCCHYDWC
jgi:hypothetical protein